MEIRLATLDDVPGMTIAIADSLRLTGHQRGRFPGCSEEEFRAYMGSRVVRYLADPRCVVWVASRKTSLYPDLEPIEGPTPEYRIVAAMIWTNYGPKFDPEPFDEACLPQVAFPACTDWECMDSVNAVKVVWKKELLEEYGSFIWADILGVVPDCQRSGAGTALSKILVKAAEDAEVPVFTTTTAYSIPFYDRLGFLNGYKYVYERDPFQPKTKIPVCTNLLRFYRGDDTAGNRGKLRS